MSPDRIVRETRMRHALFDLKVEIYLLEMVIEIIIPYIFSYSIKVRREFRYFSENLLTRKYFE